MPTSRAGMDTVISEPTLAQRLGYGADDKVVIINADDLGSCHSANVGVFECLSTGTVTSATLMVPCPWAREASSRYRGEDIGVHLTLNAEYELYRWGPITFAPSLLGGDGGFPRTIEDVWDHADLDEVRRECRAQIERAILWGFDVSHLDSHMGTLQMRPEFFDVYLDLALEFALPLRMVGTGMERLLGFPARAVARRSRRGVQRSHALCSRCRFALHVRKRPEHPSARCHRTAPAPSRRERRADVLGHRRLASPGRRLPDDLRGVLGARGPGGGRRQADRLSPPERVGPRQAMTARGERVGAQVPARPAKRSSSVTSVGPTRLAARRN